MFADVLRFVREPGTNGEPDPHEGGHYISRRVRLQYVVTPLVGVRSPLIGVVLCLCFLLVACNASPAIPAPSAGRAPYSYTPVSTATHQPVGTIVFSDTQFPDTVNPLFASSVIDFEVRDALWAAPVVYDNQFHAHPDQLTEVPLPENGGVQDQGKTIIMHLRHDLRWSDGQPLLASDFRYWWQLNQDPATGAITTIGYDQIASIDTPDQFTVILHMRQPFGSYLSYLPYAAPQHLWKTLQDIDLQNTPSVFASPSVTDGPYMLKRFVAGQSYTMAPSPDYTSSTFHGPFAAQLVYRSYSTLNALTLAAQTQQTDVAEGYQESDIPHLSGIETASTVKVVEEPTAAYEHLDFNMVQPLFRDLRVRRAIQMAIDTCAFLKNALHAADCARLVSQIEPLPSPVYDPSIQPVTYDPGMARTLLAQAGWLPHREGLLMKQGQPFIVHLVTTADSPLRAVLAEAIRKNLLAVGIQVDVQYYPLGRFFAVYTRGGILATGAYDLSLFTYANGPEPNQEYSVFHSSQIPSADNPYGGNYGRVNDPIIDLTLTQGHDTIPQAQRAVFYHQFLQRLAQEVYVIPLYTEVTVIVVNTHMHNVIPNSNQADNNWNIVDWWRSS